MIGSDDTLYIQQEIMDDQVDVNNILVITWIKVLQMLNKKTRICPL